MIHLHPLTASDPQTCDWGYCDSRAVAVRLDVEDPLPWDVWLSVCELHARSEDGSRDV